MKTLQHFIMKSQILLIYRKFQKLIIKTNNYEELNSLVKIEFQNNKNIEDINKIKFLYSESLKQYKELENNLYISL